MDVFVNLYLTISVPQGSIILIQVLRHFCTFCSLLMWYLLIACKIISSLPVFHEKANI